MPTFPTTRYPWEQIAEIALETTPGTAGTAWLREICHSITLGHVGQDDSEEGYGGVGATVFGFTRVQQHSEPALSFDARNDGFFGLACALIAGSTSDTVGAPASGIYPHTIIPAYNNVRENTVTIVDGKTGDTANAEQATYCTLGSLHVTSNPSGAVRADLSFQGRYPTFLSLPAATNTIGVTSAYKRTRQYGNKMAATIYGSSGSAYTCNIYGVDLTISRGLELIPNPNGKDPQDIVPGVLNVAGSFTGIYDGAGAATVYRDMANFAELGDSSHVHKFIWTDPDTRTAEFDIWPLKITADPLDPSGNAFKFTASFETYNDMATILGGSPAMTNLKQIILQSTVSTPFVS